MSTIALCIPAYNAAWCLPRLLDSASNQTIPFDEVLIYDDCSTDETSSVAEQWGAHVIRGDINRGCSAGKNRLALETSCSWIHFHDADDILLPNFVEVARQWIIRSEAPDVVLLHFEYRDFQTGELLAVPDYDVDLMQQDPIEFVLRYKVVNFGLYRRASFLDAGGFDVDPNVLYNEDAAFHNRLAIAGLKFNYEPVLTCINYRYAASMSVSNQRKCSQAQLCVLTKTARALQGRYSPIIAERLWQTAGISASFKDWPTAIKAAAAARDLGYPMPPDGHGLYRLFARFVPGLAIRLREYAIRLLSPHLRNSDTLSEKLN